MELIEKIFGAKEQEAPQPLRVEGIPDAPITPEPDEVELAAQALLESLAEEVRERRKWRMSRRKKGNTQKGKALLEGQSNQNTQSNQSNQSNPNTPSAPHDAAYYQRLAEKICRAHEIAALRATRFVAACEYTLKDKHLPFYGEGSVQMLETELYKRIDIIERAGGELKRRWQHCLADVTVRLMDAPPPAEKPHAESTEKKATQKE